MKDPAINSNTTLFCIFGSPVRHSVSPLMHNAAFRERGINAVYLAFEPPSIGDAVASMKTLGIRGASVTIPYKIEVLKHLDSIDPLAARIGSVNTLVNNSGTITGYNTDGHGAVMSLENAGVDLKAKGCIVIGNGGSARAIAFTLAERGASVVIAGRNRERIENLADDLRCSSPGTRSALLGEIDSAFMERIDIVINTTPVGMVPDTGSTPFNTDLLSARHTVFDIVYAPHETRLLTAAAERGCRVVYGLDMLVLQGARQFELWTGGPAPVETMRLAAHHFFHDKS